MFSALIERVVGSQTAAHAIVSFGQVKTAFSWGSWVRRSARRMVGWLAGGCVRGGWRGRSVSRSRQCDAGDWARAKESPLTPIMNVCSGRQCRMRWSMDTLDCDRYKLLLVLPRSADVSTSPVSLDHFTPAACHPTGRVSREARAPSCHVTFT